MRTGSKLSEKSYNKRINHLLSSCFELTQTSYHIVVTAGFKRTWTEPGLTNTYHRRKYDLLRTTICVE